MTAMNVSLGQVKIAAVALMFMGLGLAGCATKNPTVEAKVAAESPTHDRGELAARGFEAWSTSAGLNADQKSKLYTVHSATAREAFRIRDEITKTKSAMFKELAKGDYDEKVVSGFKAKIVKLDQERLDIMFKALASVEKTLGRGEEAKNYYRYLEMIEAQPFRER